MRFVFLFLAFGLPAYAEEIDWLADKPTTERTPRANIEETSTRPGQTDATPTSQKAKAAKEVCRLCGEKCCCTDCGCTATTWKDGCCAIPAGHKEAYMRSITARSVPASRPFGQVGYSSIPTINAINVGEPRWSSTGMNQTGNTGIAAFVGTSGFTSAGCASGG
jgi:hypothetical protein